MSFPRPHHLRFDRVVTGGVALGLLSCPLLAASPTTWPYLVATVFLTSGTLFFLWKRDPLTKEQVLWGALILRIAFLPLLPGLTDDLYRYIWDGWLQIEGINPYRFVPENEALTDFQSSQLFHHLNSPSYYSVYPPLAQAVFAFGGWVYSIVGWKLAYYVLKCIFTAAEFGGVLLLSQMTGTRNLLLYAWNPLVLLEVAGQGHTEGLLVFLIAGLMWAIRKDAGRMASVAIAGAGMVKIYPFVLGPFLLRRYGWSAIWPGVLVVFGLSVPYAAPYTLSHIWASVDLFARLFEFNAGPYYLTKYTLWLGTGSDWSKQIGPTLRYLFLASLPVLYLLDWKEDWSFRWASLVTLGLFLALSTTVHPWYLLPVLLLSSLSIRPAWPWFWLGVVSTGTYLFYVDGSYWVWVISGWGGAGLLALWLYAESFWDLGRRIGRRFARHG